MGRPWGASCRAKMGECTLRTQPHKSAKNMTQHVLYTSLKNFEESIEALNRSIKSNNGNIKEIS